MIDQLPELQKHSFIQDAATIESKVLRKNICGWTSLQWSSNDLNTIIFHFPNLSTGN